MDSRQQQLCKQLQAMSSDEAASWLISTYPLNGEYGEVFALLTHRSWHRTDQIKLAEHFLQKMPFANSRPYEALASIMSIKLLINVIRQRIQTMVSGDYGLLHYHLAPVLKRYSRSNADQIEISQFLAKLQQIQ